MVTATQREPIDPCHPSPCGPNSQCRKMNDQAVCSCLPNYMGSPPECRPECVVSSECPLDKACTNQKCLDPCPNTCGIQALCTVRNHNPICACPAGYSGDPFSQCALIRKDIVLNYLYQITNYFIFSNDTNASSNRTSSILLSNSMWAQLTMSNTKWNTSLFLST